MMMMMLVRRVEKGFESTHPKSKSPQVQVAAYYQVTPINMPHRNTCSPHIRNQLTGLAVRQLK